MFFCVKKLKFIDLVINMLSFLPHSAERVTPTSVIEKLPDMTDAERIQLSIEIAPNNHWKHQNNKLGQQKCIPHAPAGLLSHLSWRYRSSASPPKVSPFFSQNNCN